MLWVTGLIALAASTVCVLGYAPAARRRVLRLFGSLVNDAGRAAARANPVGQLRLAADRAAGELRALQDALVQGEALLTRLGRDELSHEQELAKLQAYIQRSAGSVPDDDPVLLGYAQRYHREEVGLRATRESIQLQRAAQQQALAQAQQLALQVADLRREADALGVALDVAETQAQVAALVGRFDSRAVDGALSDAGEARRAAQDRIDAARAALTVQAQLGGPGAARAAAEADLEAREVLARLRPPAPPALGGTGVDASPDNA